MNGIITLVKETPEISLTPFLLCEGTMRRQQFGSLQCRREPLPEPDHAGAMILDLQLSER